MRDSTLALWEPLAVVVVVADFAGLAEAGVVACATIIVPVGLSTEPVALAGRAMANAAATAITLVYWFELVMFPSLLRAGDLSEEQRQAPRPVMLASHW